MKLVLFDIDGTILKSHGAGRESVSEAVERVCGRRIQPDGISFAGRTDPEIMRDLLASAGIARDEVENVLAECLRTYVSVLMQRLKPGMITVLPGVRHLVTALKARRDVALGLLTGNLQETAFLKLHAAGLGSYFAFGAFGSDREDRYHLPEIAALRASEATGFPFTSSRTVIIGDTPHDIGCANEFGAVSVGVCTGTYGRSELQACGPHVLLDDLRDAAPIYLVLESIERTDVVVN